MQELLNKVAASGGGVPNSPRWNLVREKANELTRDFSVPPIPVLDLAEKSGVNVVFSDFGPHSEMVAGFCDFQARRIHVNAKDRLPRQTFTIAHELGHWLLHRDAFLADPKKYAVLPRFQEPKNNVFEVEANGFAADLLVPRRLLLPVKGGSVTTLAVIFGVSKVMMENRLKYVR